MQEFVRPHPESSYWEPRTVQGYAHQAAVEGGTEDREHGVSAPVSLRRPDWWRFRCGGRYETV
jgi:hypothetical protein